jgi:hypothetical protein
MKNIIFSLFLFTVFTSGVLYSQNNLIEKLLFENQKQLENVLKNIDTFEVQIIYTQIDRDENNFPVFTTHKYRVNPRNYFYPASTVKLPAAILSLEKLNNLNIVGLNKYTPLKVDSASERQKAVTVDSSSESGLPSIAHYIKKVFLVSDNDAYNRLYEFLGQSAINENLHNKGYSDVKILHRFQGGLTSEDNRITNPFTFYENDRVIYRQKEARNTNTYNIELDGLSKGIGYLNSADEIVYKPFDFSARNYISLESLHEILKAVIFPESITRERRFNLTDDDYNFLYKYMSMLPKESKYPSYDTSYYDSYVKYYMFGNSKAPMPESIRIFNKVGLAYGYLTDIAYVVDFERKTEFMLSSVIHVNKNKIYNDGIYEYDEIGLPFFAELGKIIYNYELERVRKFPPNLSKFKFNYNYN